jgi:hypothetical protein
MTTKRERSQAAKILGAKGGKTVTPKKLEHLRRLGLKRRKVQPPPSA